MFNRRAGKGFCLHVEERIVLKADPNRHPRGQEAFVQDAHLAQGVIHREVLVFNQLAAARRDRNRSARYVEGVELDQRTSRRLVAATEHEFVELGLLLGAEKRRVVELLEDVALFFLLRGQLARQSRTKGLQDGQDHPASLAQDCNPLDVVKQSIWEGVVVAVDMVQIQHLNQQLVLDRRFGQEGNGQARFVVSVQHLQAEILGRKLEGIQAVHVLHHQVPNGRLHIEQGVLQQLQYQRLGRDNTVVGKFADLVGPAVSRVLVGDRKNFILVECGVQGHIAQLRVEGVFVGLKLACVGEFRVFHVGVVAGSRQGGARAGRISDAREALHQFLGIQQVYPVAGQWIGRGPWKNDIARTVIGGRTPGLALPLPQIRERNKVAHFRGRATAVGYPNLQARNLHGRLNDRQRAHPLLVVVAEVMAQKEVAVGLVGIALNQEFLGGRTPLNVEVLALAALLRHHRRYRRISKLELPLQTKQALRARDEASARGQADVAHLQRLDDIVFSAFEIQLHFVFKRKRRLRIVVDLHVQTIAQLTGSVHLHFLVKVKREGLPVAFGYDRIFNVLEAQTKPDFRRALRPNFQLIRPKDVLDRRIGNGHVRHNARSLPAVRGRTLGPARLPALGLLLAKNELLVFGRRIVNRAADGNRSDVLLLDIKTRNGIVGHHGPNIRRRTQPRHRPRRAAVLNLCLRSENG